MSTIAAQRAKIQRTTDWAGYRDDRTYLHAVFPDAIAAVGAATKRPLAIGIKHSLTGYLSDAALTNFLRAYTFGPKYLTALKAGAHRYALDGAIVGTVTEREAEHAALCLRTHYAAQKCHRPAAYVRPNSLRALQGGTAQQIADDMLREWQGNGRQMQEAA